MPNYLDSQQVTVSPNTKILVEALAAFLQVPPPAIIDKALRDCRDSPRPEDRATLEAFRGRAINNHEALLSEATRQAAATGQPMVIYESARFCCKRDRIDKLGPQDQFRMVTPVGVFQMSKADFYREFPNVVASESYKAGVYNYPRLPSKAEGFRVPGSTLHEIRRHYENRIQALLNRCREACMARNWATTEPGAGFEKLPNGHPVYSWWIDAEIAVDRRAHVAVILESETDADEAGSFVTLINCFPSSSLGTMGSDYVGWEAPRISEPLDDSEAFERKLRSLEQVTGLQVSDAVEKHVRGEGKTTLRVSPGRLASSPQGPVPARPKGGAVGGHAVLRAFRSPTSRALIKSGQC